MIVIAILISLLKIVHNYIPVRQSIFLHERPKRGIMQTDLRVYIYAFLCKRNVKKQYVMYNVFKEEKFTD